MKKYEELDKVLEQFKPYELASYLVMNNIKFAEELEECIKAEIYIQSVEDDRQAIMDFNNED